jgi:hypothetical protein
MTHHQLTLRAGKKRYRSDEAVPAEGVSFAPHGFQIVHRLYLAASFNGPLPQ